MAMKSSKHQSLFAIIAASIIASGCAAPNQYRPTIDTQGGDMAKYRADMADCQSYADQVSVGDNAAAGAVVGALLGLVIGAVLDPRGPKGRYASAGALGGASGGATRGVQDYQGTFQNCMRGRGWNVLR